MHSEISEYSVYPQICVHGHIKPEGCIGSMTGDLLETTQDIMINATRNFYKHFVAVKTTKS